MCFLFFDETSKTLLFEIILFFFKLNFDIFTAKLSLSIKVIFEYGISFFAAIPKIPLPEP